MKVGDLVNPIPHHYSRPYGYTTEDTINHGLGIIIDFYQEPGETYAVYFKVQWTHLKIEWWAREDLCLINEGESP